MQKTKKSIAKRFKFTGSGKLVRRSPGMRHLLSRKTRKQKRRLGQAKLVSETHADSFRKSMPFGG
jgi:large subunit ribosomal protein L35